MKKNKSASLVPMKDILLEFGGHYVKHTATELPDPEVREDRLRVSGFPFCGLRAAYKKLVKHTKEPVMTLGMKYYTGVGTLSHEIIQDWLGLGGRILGQWRCTAPGCIGLRQISRRNDCPICKAQMKYEELTVTAFKHLSGHLDGIYKADNGEYFVIDYKTSSVRVITTQHEQRTLPYHGNVCQIRAYCALIELVFNIKISGWMLHYIARDAPLKVYRTEGRRITDEEKKAELKKIKLYDRHWDIVANLKKFEQIKVLISEKPCATDEFYKKEFHGFTPCPLSQGGVCFQPKRLKEIMRIVWAERPRVSNTVKTEE